MRVRLQVGIQAQFLVSSSMQHVSLPKLFCVSLSLRGACAKLAATTYVLWRGPERKWIRSIRRCNEVIIKTWGFILTANESTVYSLLTSYITTRMVGPSRDVYVYICVIYISTYIYTCKYKPIFTFAFVPFTHIYMYVCLYWYSYSYVYVCSYLPSFRYRQSYLHLY